MKKNKGNVLKIFLITLAILALLAVFLNFSAQSDRDYQHSEYEAAKQEWENHRVLINNDLGVLNQQLERYKYVERASDISYLNAKIGPRLDILDLHLIEARTFLNTYGSLFPNEAELRSQIDEKIVRSQTIRNQINTFVDEYNSEIKAYNAQVEGILGLFDLII